MKTSEQIRNEAIDYHQRQIERLYEERIRIDNQIESIEKLIKELIEIYK